jgi:hypothetical protein
MLSSYNFFFIDEKSLNDLVNNLMSQRLTKAVLIEFNNIRCSDSGQIKEILSQFERNAKLFLKKLYSNMHNRSSLNVKAQHLSIYK